MLNANTKCFSVQQRLPEPYNRKAQPPVIVVYDGLGPYYYFEKGGIRFFAMYHPSALLRNEQNRPDTFRDLKKLQSAILEISDHPERYEIL